LTFSRAQVVAGVVSAQDCSTTAIAEFSSTRMTCSQPVVSSSPEPPPLTDAEGYATCWIE